MIRDGRPYSIENGFEDGELISELTYNEIRMVDEWIRKNIRRSRRILTGRTSYGLKHVLQNDTGIYLTNNAFKDAMLLSGYEPVDPNELNWRYRIILVKDVNYNTSPFFRWVRENYEMECTPEGDFADDMISDKDFPGLAEHDVIKNYLEGIAACDDALSVFEKLWKEYERAKN